MILYYTNILVEFYINNTQIVKELRKIGQNQLTISTIPQAELYYGALNKSELKKIKQHLTMLNQFSLDGSISFKFLQLMESHTLSHRLSIPDALIAATALIHHLELFTLNIKDIKYISNLKLYQPTHASL